MTKSRPRAALVDTANVEYGESFKRRSRRRFHLPRGHHHAPTMTTNDAGNNNATDDFNRKTRMPNVLLSNGRFPVTLDLARQLKRAGCRVFALDPMEYHVCKFSNAVEKSFQTPVISEDPAGYIAVAKKVVRERNIDIIIPCHEEILYLAECPDEDIRSRLYAPSFWELYQLHNKHEFGELLEQYGFDRPESYFFTSTDDVKSKLDPNREWALKPALGRSSVGVKHLKPEQPWDVSNVSPSNPHIAQEWLYGNRYCTYGIFRDGEVQAFAIYPVLETIDGSSSVYFEAVEHDEIKEYACSLIRKLGLTGQVAFDFIETGVTEGELHRGPHGIPRGGLYRGLGKPIVKGLHCLRRSGSPDSRPEAHRRIVAIECNPRSTSGIHLWSGLPWLATAMTDTSPSAMGLAARPGRKRQTAPGMLMWDHEGAGFKRYCQHIGRLFGTKDVIFSWSDFMPVFVQPFLLASYYEMCRERGGIPLPEMFQSDVVWIPGLYKEGQSGTSGLDVQHPTEKGLLIPEKKAGIVHV